MKEAIREFEITPAIKVADVLLRYPQSLDVFVRHGFTPLRNPVLRKTMACALLRLNKLAAAKG